MKKLTWRNLAQREGKTMDFLEMPEEERAAIANRIYQETAEGLGYELRKKRESQKG